MIKLFQKRPVINYKKVKVVVIATCIVANLTALAYLAYSNYRLQDKVNQLANIEVLEPEIIATPNESSSPASYPLVSVDQLTGLEKRVKALEYKLSLVGKTVTSCSVIPEAYSAFGAKPGYSDKLGVCADSYTKLQNNL